MKLKCPKTCGVCSSGTASNNSGDGISRNNDDDFYVPGNNVGDDNERFGGNPSVPRLCEDILTSFSLLENKPSESIITCGDLEKSQYRLACTWKRIEKKW